MHPDPQVESPLEPAPASAQAPRPARPARAHVAFLGIVLISMLVTVFVRRGHEEFPGPMLLVLTVVAWAPLLVCARRPVAALVGALLAESLHLIVVPYVNPGLVAPIAMGAYQPVPLATMAAACVAAAAVPGPAGGRRSESTKDRSDST